MESHEHMPGKELKFRLGQLTVKFVFRHKWDTPGNDNVADVEYRTKYFGLFFKKQLAFISKKKNRWLFNNSNLLPIHTFGVNLIYAKAWIEIGVRKETKQSHRPHEPFDGC